MNQIKIGKFIAEERKNKNLTQLDLANILGVSDRSVSKWENGKCLPDISLFEPICNEFNISVSEFLAGERNKEKKSDNKEVINFIKQTKKKGTHKFIVLGIISILLITFVLSTVIYFFNTYNKIAVFFFTIYENKKICKTSIY